MKRGLATAAIAFLAMIWSPAAVSQELPLPSPRNVVIISLEQNPQNAAEVDYIKSNLKFGLFAWLSFSITALTPELGWHKSLNEASDGIQQFKEDVNTLIKAAKAKGVRLHLVLTSGVARNLGVYRAAKDEDIRNCQWYNDNKLAADDQITLDVMDSVIFGTLSRYARKMRANLEAKSRASMVFLKQAIAENVDTLIAVSGWGEAELSFHRIDHTKSIQDAFCDYSPFAVLEFRDWIRHEGLYREGGKYSGQGYSKGGSIYQGAAGLVRFNADWGTAFSTWDLRFFNWSLADDFDRNPEDAANNDPRRIPRPSYSHGNMMPASRPDYIAGGFDPPRIMAPGQKFWDLWELFRETMVAHFVRDAAQWASEAGIAADRWFSHQIPADYLYNTNPSVPNKNARFFTSASALWTANIAPYGGAGATIYDIKFPVDANPAEYVRTTSFALPAISAMSPLWAIMEYDAETYPEGFQTAESPSDLILEQYLCVHSFGPYLINFWRWEDNGEHQIKGKNKETALRKYIEKIRDKGRVQDLSVVYTPPRVTGIRAETPNRQNKVRLLLDGKIWAGSPWDWKEWGDFSHFEIFRGTKLGFSPDNDHRLGTTSDYFFDDSTTTRRTTYYYKVRAVNVKKEAGPVSREIVARPN